MRLPAVAIAAAFASGILLGLHPAVARNAASSLLLSIFFVAIAVLILTGIFLVRIGRHFLAAVASGTRATPFEDAFALARPPAR